MGQWDDQDDAALLAATASCPEAFGAFYRRHVRRVLAYCRRRTGSAELALDLTAEVFACALERSSRYRPVADTAAPWLVGIARHKLADSARRGVIEDRARRRLAMRPLEVTDEHAQLLDAIAAAELLGDSVEELSRDQRDALVARVAEERDYKDIASALRCSESVVRKRVSRALSKLRTRMEET